MPSSEPSVEPEARAGTTLVPARGSVDLDAPAGFVPAVPAAAPPAFAPYSEPHAVVNVCRTTSVRRLKPPAMDMGARVWSG